MLMRRLIDEKKIRAVVTSVRWERIFLYLDVMVTWEIPEEADQGGLCFYAVSSLFYAPAAFKVVGQEGGLYHLKLNITNGGENACLPSSEYRLYVCKDDCILADCEADPKIIPHMSDYSRTFLYSSRNKSYTVVFHLEEEAEDLIFRFYILAAEKTEIGFPTLRLRDKIQLFRNLKGTWFSSKKIIKKFYSICRVLYGANREKTILFMSEQNTVIASNLKAVSDRMKERGLDKEYRLLYSARSAKGESHGALNWFVLMKKIAQSGVILIDDHAPVLDWLILPKDTKLIQLWHAGAGFKSSGYSRWGHLGAPGTTSSHRQYRYGIAGSKNIAPFFSEVWGINDEQVIPTGMPRMDEFLNEEYRREKTKQLYEKYPICKGKKVMLYAPTYRGRNRSDAHYPYGLIDFDGLYEACGEEYVVLFKMHPWVKRKVPIDPNFRDKFMDVGKYPNINDLFYITDLLVTDYSSNIFEYSLMRKPMLFFAYDKVQYSFSRGFHRDYEEAAPGKVCYTFSEFLEAFQNRDFEYEKVERYIEQHFDYIDSHASDRVIDWLILDKLPTEMREALERVEKENAHRKSLDFLPEGYWREDDKVFKEEEKY